MIAAFFLAAGSANMAAAQEDGLFRQRDDGWYEPPHSLPEGVQGVVRPNANVSSPSRINTLREVFQALQFCWSPPAGSGYSGQEITLRLGFKRNGEVLGKPRITYYKAGTQGEQREPFTRSVREAFERCTPLPFTESFGAAIAGRIFAFRFVDARPM
jgi:hypothetical protein